RLLTWTHISYVKRGERLALYINGALDSSAELRGRSQGNSGPLHLGSDPWYPGIAGGLHEIRIYDRPLSAIEVAALATDLAGAEARYRQTAYEALLNRLGVSYADIRLARGAQAEERKSLAERLGVRLSPTRPDELDELRLHPSQITDSFLESFCGLGDTRLDPLQPVVPAPKLLAWQLDNLRALWLQQDHPTMAGATASSLIIDPDVMGRADLRNAYPTDKAFELWEERRNWLQGAITELQEKRTTFADPEDALNAAMGLAFSTPVAQVWQLADDQANGVDIRPALAKLNLFPGMFRRLCRVRALAQAGAVTDDEWEDVDDILIAVQKAQLEPAWRTAEKTLALSPDWFVVNDDAGALPCWRVPGTARIDWQDRLQARIGQQRNAEEAYWSAVAAAEEVALPLLRDALVSVVAASQGLSNAADWLTEQLLVDFKGNGSQQTTRIEQAIETIQVALTSLRMERFATGHLAAQWCRRPDQSEADFDEEWKWMGSYASWRAAMLVFFFPENLLLPGLLLRMDRATSPHYENFMAKLREKSRLRPDVARKTVDQEYLAPLKADAAVEPAIRDVVFQITDQLDHRGFETRRALSEQLMRNWVDGATGRLRSDTPAYLNEAFYFVPMQVALQLQKSGEYVAALDWYQTVYAFNLLDNPATADVDERAIYYALRLEQNTQPNLSRVGRWLFDLNPHVIAAGRPNPYMRYTLMCIARCFLEYADAEFARDTGESLAHARDLYLAARRLLQSPHLQTPPVIDSTQIVLPNPVLESLHWRVENQLAKLRQGRNIAGMKRQVELPLPAAPLSSGLPSASTTDQLPGPPSQVLRPTPYRYQVLIERSKQLANIAQQMEANYLSLLEKRDVEEARRIEAGFRLDVAKATESMQALRVTEATNGVELARRQMKRARIQQNKYQEWIDAGLNDWEQQMIRSYRKAGEAEKSAHLFGAAVQIAQAITTASTAFGWEKLGAYASVAAVSTGALGAAINNNLAIDAQTQAQIASIGASHERRRQEWELQKSLADQDYAIGEQQALIASDHVAIRKQEQAISTIQTEEAKAIADFLARKFTNVELYEWMSGVLAGIYSYFLQQATSMAQLAQNQLIFERQTPSPGFILADYWQPPADAGGSTTGGQATDRRGMTGAERLLADIYRLDLYAFENDRRK
ncbi:MAG: hypothetical protein H3C34_27075, partial [Caldilineaceae bacterium]|nr:hypothetical protein [Caldilineaceae bacterium]